jgi:hypothetical protein
VESPKKGLSLSDHTEKNNPAQEQNRKPLLTERCRLLLLRAGPAGCTAAELAREIYGEDSQPARYKVVATVQRLRRRVSVVTVRDAAFWDRRYVLSQFVVSTVPL